MSSFCGTPIKKLESGHSIECITHAGRAAPSRWPASQCNETAPHGCLAATLCTFWSCDLDLWLFDLVFTGGRGIVMDHPCAKFGDFSLSRFVFIVRTDRQRDTHTHTHTHTQRERERERITNSDDFYTQPTTVGVSNEYVLRVQGVFFRSHFHYFNISWLMVTRYWNTAVTQLTLNDYVGVINTTTSYMT